MMHNKGLPDAEKAHTAKIAHAFLFHYWMATCSRVSRFAPLPSFENLYFALVAPTTASYVSRDDPLGIKGSYVDGVLKGYVLTWTDLTLTRADLDTWAKYQAFVAAFNAFVDDRRSKIRARRIAGEDRKE
jgi:hypothetical protein